MKSKYDKVRKINKKYIRKPTYKAPVSLPSVEIKKYETTIKTLKDNSSGSSTVFGSTLLIGLHPC